MLMDIFALNEVQEEQEVVCSFYLGMCLGVHEATGSTCMPSQGLLEKVICFLCCVCVYIHTYTMYLFICMYINK